MANTDTTERIDLNDKAACESWVHKLNITHEKLREVVGTVGDDPRRVEEHVRGIQSQQGSSNTQP